MNNLYRMVDANGVEVVLFEITALCAIATKSIKDAEDAKSASESS